MVIASHLVTQQPGPLLMVFDAVVDGRDLHIGLVMGEVKEDGRTAISPLGAQCVARVRRRGLERDHQSQLTMVPLDEAEAVGHHMHRAFGEADPADALVFVCADRKVYSSALRRLTAQRHTGGAAVVRPAGMALRASAAH